eukprot:scaffold39549_cov21-Phaeocystis_antarctica.AAC.1
MIAVGEPPDTFSGSLSWHRRCLHYTPLRQCGAYLERGGEETAEAREHARAGKLPIQVAAHPPLLALLP